MANELPTRRRVNYIAKWRKFRGLSQEQCAEAAGMSAPNLSQIENGVVNYTSDSLQRLAIALETTPGRLLEVDPFALDELDKIAMNQTLSPEQRAELASIAHVIELRSAYLRHGRAGCLSPSRQRAPIPASWHQLSPPLFQDTFESSTISNGWTTSRR